MAVSVHVVYDTRTMDDVLSSSEVSRLFACLRSYRRLVLGVSGGADSLCLMHLVADWLLGLEPDDRPAVLVVTIDHRLRAASAEEAAEVARRAALLGLPHRMLTWNEPKPQSGLQAEAREMRYRLLLDAARGDGRAAVVVAHTEDDQAETLIMRLKRGSGVDGLSGMAPVRALGEGVDLVRPLLKLPRSRIEATLASRGVTWLSDPSNDSLAFERVRVRKASEARDALGLANEMLALSAERLLRARKALDAVTLEFLRREALLHEGVYASLSRARFRDAPADIQVRVLERLVGCYGGAAPEPALLSQIEAVAGEVGSAASCRVSVGGAIVSAGERNIRVYREVGRLAAEHVPLSPGASLLWDGRFRIFAEAREGPRDHFAVAPLGFGGGTSADATLAVAGLVVPEAAKDWPRRALATLPAIWAGSRLIAVPHFDLVAGTDNGFRVEFRGLEAEI